jgi:tetratricopeptide (TPR) repeat protein
MPRKPLLAVLCLIAATLAVPTRLRASEPVDELVAARKLLVSFEWDQAHEAFLEVAKKAPPKSDRWVEATFGAAVAISQGQPQDPDRVIEADKLYTLILEQTPQSKFVPRVMMNLGRLKELVDYKGDVVDLVGARAEYTKVTEKYPNDPIAGEATLRAAATLIQTYDAKDQYANVKQGIGLLEKWLASHPNEPLASAMWQYVADTYFFPLNDNKAALAAYAKVDALGWTDRGNEGPWLWRCAVLSEKEGQTASAIKYYTKIITTTPNSGKAYESSLALKRLGAPVPEINILKTRTTTRPAEGGAK